MGQLDGLHSEAIMNNAAMNISAQIFVQTRMESFQLSSIYLVMEMLGHTVPLGLIS